MDGDSVAGQHDGQGDEKTQSVAENSGGQSPLISSAGIVFFSAQYVTRVVRGESGAEQAREGQKRSDNPDGGTNSPADQLSISPTNLHGTHNHSVPVHTDASQEENGWVEAHLLEDSDYFAHGFSKYPAPSNRGGPEREGDGEQEVCDRQVEEVEVRRGQRLLA